MAVEAMHVSPASSGVATAPRNNYYTRPTTFPPSFLSCRYTVAYFHRWISKTTKSPRAGRVSRRTRAPRLPVRARGLLLCLTGIKLERGIMRCVHIGRNATRREGRINAKTRAEDSLPDLRRRRDPPRRTLDLLQGHRTTPTWTHLRLPQE